MSKWRPKGWTVATGMRLYKGKLLGNTREAFEAGANTMLEAISEEIEKELSGREEDMIADADYKEGWLDCKHWILVLFRSNKEG